MPSGVTNRVQIALVEETTWGTIPTTPAFQKLRITQAPNLAFNPQTIVSNEIRVDRQVTDLILVNSEAGGDIGFELSFNSLYHLLEGALFNDWNEYPSQGCTAVDGTTNDSYTVTTGSLYSTGMLIVGTGFTNSGNNVITRIESVSTNELLTDGSLVDETPPAAARVRAIGVKGAAANDTWACTSSPNTLTSSGGSATDFTTANFDLAAGDWIRLAGFTNNTANNDWCRISSVAAGVITFDIVPSGWDTDAGGVSKILYFGDKITDGTTEKSYTIEELFDDITVYQRFPGMEVNTLNLTISPAAIVNGTVSFMGKSASTSASALSGSTYATAPTHDVLNASSDIGRIAENGTVVSDPNYVLEAQITINNNLRQKPAVGQLGSVDIGAGELNISGNLNTYFGDTTLLTKLLNNTATSLDMRFFDNSSDNRTILIDIPRLKFSSGFPEVPGKNQEIPLNMGFQAYLHPTLQYTIKVQQFHYIP